MIYLPGKTGRLMSGLGAMVSTRTVSAPRNTIVPARLPSPGPGSYVRVSGTAPVYYIDDARAAHHIPDWPTMESMTGTTSPAAAEALVQNISQYAFHYTIGSEIPAYVAPPPAAVAAPPVAPVSAPNVIAAPPPVTTTSLPPVAPNTVAAPTDWTSWFTAESSLPVVGETPNWEWLAGLVIVGVLLLHSGARSHR
jgi:hypothetical protein